MSENHIRAFLFTAMIAVDPYNISLVLCGFLLIQAIKDFGYGIVNSFIGSHCWLGFLNACIVSHYG